MNPGDKKKHKDINFIINKAKHKRENPVGKAPRQKPPESPKRNIAPPPQPKHKPAPKKKRCSTPEPSQALETLAEIKKQVGYIEMVSELQAACDRNVGETHEQETARPSLLRRLWNFITGR